MCAVEVDQILRVISNEHEVAGRQISVAYNLARTSERGSRCRIVKAPHQSGRRAHLRVTPTTPLKIRRHPSNSVVNDFPSFLIEAVEAGRTFVSALGEFRKQLVHESRMSTGRSPNRVVNPHDTGSHATASKRAFRLHRARR